jgi:methylglyoxal synthase
MIKLKICNAETLAELRDFDLTLAIKKNGECLVGRSPDLGVVLDSNDVSRYHGKFFIQDEGYYFCDLGSSNGSVINDNPIEKDRAYSLKNGDAIHIGEFVLFFEEQPDELERTVVRVIDPSMFMLKPLDAVSNPSTVEISPVSATDNEVRSADNLDLDEKITSSSAGFDEPEVPEAVQLEISPDRNELAVAESVAGESDEIDSDEQQLAVVNEKNSSSEAESNNLLSELAIENDNEIEEIDTLTQSDYPDNLIIYGGQNEAINEDRFADLATTDEAEKESNDLLENEDEGEDLVVASQSNSVIDDDIVVDEVEEGEDLNEIDSAANEIEDEGEHLAVPTTQSDAAVDDDVDEVNEEEGEDLAANEIEDEGEYLAVPATQSDTAVDDDVDDVNEEEGEDLAANQIEDKGEYLAVPTTQSDTAVDDDVDDVNENEGEDLAITDSATNDIDDDIENEGEDLNIAAPQSDLSANDDVDAEDDDAEAATAEITAPPVENEEENRFGVATAATVTAGMAGVMLANGISNQNEAEIATDSSMSEPNVSIDKQILAIAHDTKISELIEFIELHKNFFAKCSVVSWASIGQELQQQTGIDLSEGIPPGISGGYQKIAALINAGDVDAVIFLRDFLQPQPGQTNEEALLRLCNINEMLLATNIATAAAIVSHLSK